MSATLDPVDILALLEETPYHEAELVEALGVSARVVRVALKALKRAGQVKRTGEVGKWALTSYVAPIGRKPQVDRQALRLALLAALAAKPLRTAALVAAMPGFSRTNIRVEADLMVKAGKLQHVGASRTARWALPGVVLAAPAKPKSSTPASSLLGDQGTKIYPAARATIGESDATVITKKKAKPSDDSWWTPFAAPDADRDAFSAAAARRNAEMLEKSSTWKQQRAQVNL